MHFYDISHVADTLFFIPSDRRWPIFCRSIKIDIKIDLKSSDAEIVQLQATTFDTYSHESVLILKFSAQHKKVYQIPIDAERQPTLKTRKNIIERQSWMPDNDNFMLLIKGKIHWEMNDASNLTQTDEVGDEKCGLKPMMLMQVLQCFIARLECWLEVARLHMWSHVVITARCINILELHGIIAWLLTIVGCCENRIGCNRKRWKYFRSRNIRTSRWKSWPKAQKTGRPFYAQSETCWLTQKGNESSA